MKITDAEIRDTEILPGIPGQSEVHVTYEDGSTAKLLSFYRDEISFTRDEFIGLTATEAGDLFRNKDLRYLRS